MSFNSYYMAEAGKPRYEFDIRQLSATKHVIKRPFQKHPAQSDYSCIAEIYYLVKTHCNSIRSKRNIVLVGLRSFVGHWVQVVPRFHNNISYSQLSTVSGFNYLKIFMSWDGSRVCCFYLFLYHVMLIRSSCYNIQADRRPGRHTHIISIN